MAARRRQRAPRHLRAGELALVLAELAERQAEATREARQVEARRARRGLLILALATALLLGLTAQGRERLQGRARQAPPAQRQDTRDAAAQVRQDRTPRAWR